MILLLLPFLINGLCVELVSCLTSCLSTLEKFDKNAILKLKTIFFYLLLLEVDPLFLNIPVNLSFKSFLLPFVSSFISELELGCNNNL